METHIQCHLLILSTSTEKKQSYIKLWTRFIPSEKFEEQLEDSPVKAYGLSLIQKAENITSIKDSYNQNIHLENYNPNYLQLEKSIKESLKDINAKPLDEYLLNQILFDKISHTPIIENWQYKMMHSYRYSLQQIKNSFNDNLATILWNGYLARIISSAAGENSNKEEKKGEENKIKEPVENSWLNFDNLNKWKANNSWEYAELVFLFKLGVPKYLRPRIWSKLMNICKQAQLGSENEQLAFYVEKSRFQDSQVYQQMENDILELITADHTIYQTRTEVLKIVKAYYAWCLEENSKQINGKTTSYGNFYIQIRI